MEKYIEIKPEDLGTERDPFRMKYIKLLRRRHKARQNPLRKRLQAHLIDNGYDVEEPVRLYPGHLQRSSGAWLWSARYKGSVQEIGSIWTMKECLKASGDKLFDMID